MLFLGSGVDIGLYDPRKRPPVAVSLTGADPIDSETNIHWSPCSRADTRTDSWVRGR